MNGNEILAGFLRLGRRLGRPDILFWSLPWLMVLIVIGTVTQKTIGLYAAQNTYFSSFLWWFYGIPLPGGYTILAIMSVNLLCKFLFLSQWTRDKTGIHITHLSVIILMIGGLLTALTMEEGYIALKQGENSAIIRDYHDRVLTLTSHDAGGSVVTIPFDRWDDPQAFAGLPFTMTVTHSCKNTAIRPRGDRDADTNDGIGAASMADIVCVPPLPDHERNVAGVAYQVTDGDDAAENGSYIAFEGRQTEDTVGGYTIRADRAARTLPFDITLQAFHRDVYPGTNRPRDYQSRVVIRDGDVTWPAVISMNEPLRYGGYTLYQASTMIDEGGQQVSVLSAVKNTGWVFPYVSGILLMTGLIIHLMIRLRGRQR